jgi:galactokinase
VEIARSLPGCLGARLTGGGFGGATLNLVRRKGAEEFRDQLLETYRRQSGKEPRAWIVNAADGAA